MRTYVTTDPERAVAELANAQDGIVGMIAGLSDRVDAHDQMIGRNGEMMKKLVFEAVSEAIQKTASDPELWASVRKAMVTQTKEAAGGWLLDGLGGIGSKVFWVSIALAALYLVGGIPLLLKTLKGLVVQGP